jgi:hypothetical protein
MGGQIQSYSFLICVILGKIENMTSLSLMFLTAFAHRSLFAVQDLQARTDSPGSGLGLRPSLSMPVYH